jgi:hypothetical protein
MTRSTSRRYTYMLSLPVWLIFLSVFFMGMMGKAHGAADGSVQIKVDQVGYLLGAAAVICGKGPC